MIDRERPQGQDFVGSTIEHNHAALAEVKRFVERWQGDPDFRRRFRENPDRALVERDLKLVHGDVSYLLNPNAVDPDETPLGETIRELSCALQTTATATEQIDTRLDASFADERFRRWRQRQVRRLQSQQLLDGYSDTGHFPIAFELSNGCSVGCWFCSVAAENLQGVFPYTAPNAQMWRAILATIKRKFGAAAKEGSCYCATDPFDNPDYENFAMDFCDILDRFPATTTALASRYPERARALIQLARSHGGSTRFSVLSVPMLDRIHEQFTARELSSTTLLLLMDGAKGVVRSIAGRARTNHNRRKASDAWTDDYAPSCVSGFVVNMVTRRIQLVSPCRPCERWPNGHRVHAESHFTDEVDLETTFENMIAAHMPIRWVSSKSLRFRPDLEYIEIDGGFQLSTRYKHFNIRHSSYPLRELGSFIKGNGQANPIEAMAQHGAEPSETDRHLDRLFDHGFLDDGL